MATSSNKVAVLGAAGGIGQPLSMLLKLSPLVDELSCYDIVGTPGVAADLSHVSVVFHGWNIKVRLTKKSQKRILLTQLLAFVISSFLFGNHII